MSPAEQMPATRSALNSEWQLLLASCSVDSDREKPKRIRALLQQAVQWKSLFALADRHGVAPLLYQTLSACKIRVPTEELRDLRDNYHRNVHKALFLSRELIRILQHLSALGVDAIPYKGLALAESMYGDIALRQSGDIDLLIRAQDLSHIIAAVGELGYTPHVTFSDVEQRAYLKSGYELAFDGQAGPNLLEVQWDLQPRFYAVDYDMGGIFQRAVTTTIAGHSAKTPSPEDLLMVLSLHAAKHVWGRLIWLRDIAQIMALPTLDWSWIEGQARELGIARILGVTLLLTHSLLEASIPAGAEKFVADTITRSLADGIQIHIVREANYDLESVAYFKLMIRLRERRSDRLRFLYRLALTPGPNEWKAVRLPAPLFPLYRVVRLWRLATRIVRG
jgi:Uncharacterised nucleotidyltransferase